MGTTAQKLSYLESTKTAIKDAIVSSGVEVQDGTTFREYANKIGTIVGQFSNDLDEIIGADTTSVVDAIGLVDMINGEDVSGSAGGSSVETGVFALSCIAGSGAYMPIWEVYWFDENHQQQSKKLYNAGVEEIIMPKGCYVLINVLTNGSFSVSGGVETIFTIDDSDKNMTRGVFKFTDAGTCYATCNY